MIKTPLRFPGGKSKAIPKLSTMIDLERYGEIREPFVGGGSFFIWVRQTHPDKKVWINDLYFPLYCFWKVLAEEPERLAKEVFFIREKNRDAEKMKATFFKCREKLATADEFWSAVYFFVINRCSFSGATESGGFSKQAAEKRFTSSNISNILKVAPLLKDVKITNEDYSALLKNKKNTYLFLDPPYDIKQGLYGKNGDHHKGFDHALFAEKVLKSSNDFGITYNKNENIEQLFSSCNIQEYSLKYSMAQYEKKRKDKIELFISRVKGTK